MQISEMLHDDDAVSPVIGVILMVAITVILAAVIASFVLGLGPGDPAPTASFDFEQTADEEITVTHANGDTLDASNIYIRGDNISTGDSNGDVGDNNEWEGEGSQDQIGGGNSAVVKLEGSSEGENEIRVVWETSDSSQTLDSATVTVDN